MVSVFLIYNFFTNKNSQERKLSVVSCSNLALVPPLNGKSGLQSDFAIKKNHSHNSSLHNFMVPNMCFPFQVCRWGYGRGRIFRSPRRFGSIGERLWGSWYWLAWRWRWWGRWRILNLDQKDQGLNSIIWFIWKSKYIDYIVYSLQKDFCFAKNCKLYHFHLCSFHVLP